MICMHSILTTVQCRRHSFKYWTMSLVFTGIHIVGTKLKTAWGLLWRFGQVVFVVQSNVNMFCNNKRWNNDWKCLWFGCILPSGSYIFPRLMINIYRCMLHAFECIMYSISYVYTFWAKKKVVMPGGVTCAHSVCVFVCVYHICYFYLQSSTLILHLCFTGGQTGEEEEEDWSCQASYSVQSPFCKCCTRFWP